MQSAFKHLNKFSIFIFIFFPNRLQLLQNQALRDEVPNEMLYGKIGYLYALLFVRKHLGDDCIEDGVVEKVSMWDIVTFDVNKFTHFAMNRNKLTLF